MQYSPNFPRALAPAAAAVLCLGMAACSSDQLPAGDREPVSVPATAVPSTVTEYGDQLSASDSKEYGDQLRKQGFNVVDDPQIYGSAGETIAFIKLAGCSRRIITKMWFTDPLTLDPRTEYAKPFTKPPTDKTTIKTLCDFNKYNEE